MKAPAAHRGTSEYHVLFLQLLDLVGAEREHLAEDFVVVLAKDRRRRTERARGAAQPMRQSFVRRRAHLLVIVPMPEAARREGVVLMRGGAVLVRVRRGVRR